MAVRDVNCLVATAMTLLDASQTTMITAVLDAEVSSFFEGFSSKFGRVKFLQYLFLPV
jgi:hypothetical protein